MRGVVSLLWTYLQWFHCPHRSKWQLSRPALPDPRPEGQQGQGHSNPSEERERNGRVRRDSLSSEAKMRSWRLFVRTSAVIDQLQVLPQALRVMDAMCSYPFHFFEA